jgi:hypothetical protein
MKQEPEVDADLIVEVVSDTRDGEFGSMYINTVYWSQCRETLVEELTVKYTSGIRVQLYVSRSHVARNTIPLVTIAV